MVVGGMSFFTFLLFLKESRTKQPLLNLSNEGEGGLASAKSLEDFILGFSKNDTHYLILDTLSMKASGTASTFLVV